MVINIIFCDFVLLVLTLISCRYIQFILITTGVYASRMWTTALAATLLYLSSRSLDFVKNMHKWFLPVGWG